MAHERQLRSGDHVRIRTMTGHPRGTVLDVAQPRGSVDACLVLVDGMGQALWIAGPALELDEARSQMEFPATWIRSFKDETDQGK